MAAAGYFPPPAAEWMLTFSKGQQRRALHRETK
jgi:hypothetical protein